MCKCNSVCVQLFSYISAYSLFKCPQNNHSLHRLPSTHLPITTTTTEALGEHNHRQYFSY